MGHATRAHAANIGPFSFSLRVSPHTAQHVHRPSKLPTSRSVTGEMPQASDIFLFMRRPMQPHTASHAPRQVVRIPVCDWWNITHEHALQTTDLFSPHCDSRTGPRCQQPRLPHPAEPTLDTVACNTTEQSPGCYLSRSAGITGRVAKGPWRFSCIC